MATPHSKSQDKTGIAISFAMSVCVRLSPEMEIKDAKKQRWMVIDKIVLSI